MSYDSLVVSADLDCILVFNRDYARRESEALEDRNAQLLIYSSRLQLRGIITASKILFAFVTPFGLLLVTRHPECGVFVTRYDFCGIQQKSIRIENMM